MALEDMYFVFIDVFIFVWDLQMRMLAPAISSLKSAQWQSAIH
jgi:hypothetical protein